ncbi:MAG: hypothetical protein AB1649_05520 [Chloroflexota bacterium]
MADYYEALELYTNALDRINSGGTGLGYSGIHYEVMERVRRYGRFANGREEAVQLLKQLIVEYERAHGLADEPKQSDEDYLKKFNEDDLE